MDNNTGSRNDRSAPFHSYFFRLVDLVSVEHNPDLRTSAASSSYRLILVTGGSGCLSINEDRYEALAGKGYAIAPGAALGIGSAEQAGQDLHYLCMSFDMIEVPPNRHRPLPFANREIRMDSFERTLGAMRKLMATTNPESEQEQLDYYFRFQKLMHALLKPNTATAETVTSMQAVERTVSFLNDHYHTEVSTQQLAEQAGISVKRYSVLFKKITGVTPHDYLSALRIRKAKELLLVSRQSLAEIAEQVGYRDSYYFNRRFKQITGVPPRVYVNTRRYQIMSVSYVCALLALGISPVGAPAYHLGYYANRLGGNITSIGDKSSFDYDKMQALKPDLIIGCDTLDEEERQRMERIAPIATIPWMGLQATEHLQAIGDLLGMEKQARRWIDGYERQREAANRRIKPYINTNETVGLILIEGKDLFVLGDRNVGEIMYRSFGLQPPAAIQNLLVEHPNQYGRKVTVDQLRYYEADRLFMIVYGAEAALTYRTLQSHPAWRKLAAVQQGRVQRIDPEKWVFYDVLSLAGQLDEAIHVFR